MSRGTGCVSIGSNDEGIQIERVIEYVQPEEDSYRIWVDIFLRNSSQETRSLFLLHRGSLDATNETELAWLCDSGSHGGDWLTKRAITLHEKSDQPISVIPGGFVSVGGVYYRAWKGPRDPHVVIGNSSTRNVPFTMWSIPDVGPTERYVLRLKLVMSKATFDEHVGKDGGFYSYGDSILLHRIENDDLPVYQGDDADAYRTKFAEFQHMHHLVPDMFEYVVVAPETLGWVATPISANFSPQIIPEDLQKNTMWFIADYCASTNRASTKWSVEAKRYNGFVLKLEAKDP